MKRPIKKIFIYALISVCIASCAKGGKENVDLPKHIVDYMISTISHAEEISLPPYYLLKDTDGKTWRIDSIFAKPRLVFRFSEFCCDNCINSSVELINKSDIRNNIIGFASYNNARMLRMAKKKYNISFPVYLIPMNDSEMLSEQNEKSGVPYLFLLDNELKGRYFFSPLQQYPEFLQEYLAQFSIRFKEKKEEDAEIFSRKNKDLGTVVKGQKYEMNFEYTNTTNGLLVINEVKTSCGCLVSQWDKTPLPPGKTANLVIEFTPESLGYTSKAIVVSHNQSSYPTRLKIRADVVNINQ